MFGFQVSDKILQAIEAAFIVACLVLAAVLGWKLHAAHAQVELLQKQNEQLVKDNGTLKGNVTTLQNGLETQNKAVADLAAQRDAAQAAADAALRQAGVLQRRNAGVLRQLQSAKAQTCTQAMPYVREALGAIK